MSDHQTQAQHEIVEGNYRYTVRPLGRSSHGTYYGHAMFQAHFIRAFEVAQQEWEEKVKNDPGLKYQDATYLYSMVLGIDGMPSNLILNVDDIVQSFPILQQERIEESSAEG